MIIDDNKVQSTKDMITEASCLAFQQFTRDISNVEVANNLGVSRQRIHQISKKMHLDSGVSPLIVAKLSIRGRFSPGQFYRAMADELDKLENNQKEK